MLTQAPRVPDRTMPAEAEHDHRQAEVGPPAAQELERAEDEGRQQERGEMGRILARQGGDAVVRHPIALQEGEDAERGRERRGDAVGPQQRPHQAGVVDDDIRDQYRDHEQLDERRQLGQGDVGVDGPDGAQDGPLQVGPARQWHRPEGQPADARDHVQQGEDDRRAATEGADAAHRQGLLDRDQGDESEQGEQGEPAGRARTGSDALRSSADRSLTWLVAPCVPPGPLPRAGSSRPMPHHRRSRPRSDRGGRGTGPGRQEGGGARGAGERPAGLPGP